MKFCVSEQKKPAENTDADLKIWTNESKAIPLELSEEIWSVI